MLYPAHLSSVTGKKEKEKEPLLPKLCRAMRGAAGAVDLLANTILEGIRLAFSIRDTRELRDLSPWNVPKIRSFII
jgi:hypothetical protein